jgi:CBS domain-containing protein
VGWGFVVTGVFMAFGYRVPFFGAGLGSGLWLALIGLFLRNMAIAHYAGAAVSAALAGVRVRDLMRTQGPAAPAALPIRRLVNEWFLFHDERAFPVFDGDSFVGIVCFRDVRRLTPDEWEVKTVASIMTPRSKLTAAAVDESIEGTLHKLAASDVRQLPVLDGDALAGMLFESDVMRWLEVASARSAARSALRGATAAAR